MSNATGPVAWLDLAWIGRDEAMSHKSVAGRRMHYAGKADQASTRGSKRANKHAAHSEPIYKVSQNKPRRHVPKPHPSSLNSPDPPNPPYSPCLRVTSEASPDAPTPRLAQEPGMHATITFAIRSASSYSPGPQRPATLRSTRRPVARYSVHRLERLHCIAL